MSQHPNPENQIWHILRCCGCGKALDKEGNIVDEPTEGVIMSHTYCPECEAKAYKELDAEAAKAACMQRIMGNRPVSYGILSRRKRLC